MAAILFIIGVYHLIVFVLRRDIRTLLCFCISFMLRLGMASLSVILDAMMGICLTLEYHHANLGISAAFFLSLVPQVGFNGLSFLSCRPSLGHNLFGIRTKWRSLDVSSAISAVGIIIDRT